MEPWVRKAVIDLLEKRASKLSRFSASYFGGEPLLGLEAIEEIAPAFVEICQKQQIAFNATMTTNGYLLTPELFQRLLQWRIRGYQITIDGAPEDHDSHRVLKGGGPTFQVIYGNLLEIHKLPDDFGIVLRVNFDQTNLPGMREFLELMLPFKDDPRFVFRFYPIGTWGGPNDADLEICGLHGERERQELDMLAAELGFHSETRMPYLDPRGKLGVCYAARPYNLLIGADGKIMKCTVALDTRDYNVVGHLTVDGRVDIDLDKFTKWVKPYFEEDSTCKQCFYLPVCQGCSCPLPRIASGERPCPPEKKEIVRTLASIWNSKKSMGRKYAANSLAFQ
jgi:uncharacterized protein